MKKIFSILLCGVLCSLVACNDKKNEPNGGSTSKDTTAIDTTIIDTTVVAPTDVNFTITVSDITSSTAEVAVACDSADLYFFFDKIELAALERVDVEVAADSILMYYYGSYEAQKEYIEQEYGFSSFEEAYLSQGADGFSYTGLTPNTAYAVVAFTVDMSNKIPAVGTVDTVHFATPNIKPSNNTFTVETTDYYFDILPTEYDTYFWLHESKDSLATAGVTAEEYFDAFVILYNMTGMLDWMLSTGAEQWRYCELMQDPGDYQILVAGIEAGIRTTELFVFDLHVTQEMIEAGECEPTEWGVSVKSMRKLDANTQDKSLIRLNKKIK